MIRGLKTLVGTVGGAILGALSGALTYGFLVDEQRRLKIKDSGEVAVVLIAAGAVAGGAGSHIHLRGKRGHR